MVDVILIEPFYGGSHKQLLDLLLDKLPSCNTFTLPAKKWHWRARTSALYFAQTIPKDCQKYKLLFASSVLNLAELVALRPDLGSAHKVLYFHEHQLVYPVRKQQERDFQYGYNQILSCLVADCVLFNSKYCMESFLTSINSFMKLIPDNRPKGLEQQIRPKCKVLYFPIVYPVLQDLNGTKMITLSADEILSHQSIRSKVTSSSSDTSSTTSKTSGQHTHGNLLQTIEQSKECTTSTPPYQSDLKVSLIEQTTLCMEQGDPEHSDHNSLRTNDGIHSVSTSKNIEESTMMIQEEAKKEGPLHIVWPHRWEHYKNPELFFTTLYKLAEMGLDFRLSVLGEQFSEWPEIFHDAHKILGNYIDHWGYQESKKDYYKVLMRADVVVSTADHEFFGVAMLEAIHCGCYPLCPNKLAYPEIMAKEYLYNTPQQLFKQLREFCRHPHLVRKHSIKVDTTCYSWEQLQTDYLAYLTP